jgi:hypothetical protein
MLRTSRTDQGTEDDEEHCSESQSDIFHVLFLGYQLHFNVSTPWPVCPRLGVQADGHLHIHGLAFELFTIKDLRARRANVAYGH